MQYTFTNCEELYYFYRNVFPTIFFIFGANLLWIDKKRAGVLTIPALRHPGGDAQISI